MKKIFRKAMTIVGSAALVGATLGSAFAASYPAPFTSNTAVITGANAAPSDNVAARNIVSNLDALSSGSVTSLVGGEGVTEPEVPLGSQIDFTSPTVSNIDSTINARDISSLIDEKLSWDDGTGVTDYTIHEEIAIGDMEIKTTLDDEDLEGVAMSNSAGLEYKLVFENAFPISHVGMDNSTGTADELYLTILGKQYEVSGMTSDTITVVTSQDVTLSPGESVTVDGKTFTLDDLSATAARVNGEVVTTSTKKINGLRVQIKDGTIFYNENDVGGGSVTLQIGDDISKTYSDNDEFVGEDEDDPLWVWDISNLGQENGYIGVKYSSKIEDSGDVDAGDSIKYVGEAYVMPNNFGQVSLDSISDLDYEDIEVSFDDGLDLYNASADEDEAAEVAINNGHVVVIKGEDTDTLTINTIETSEIYLYYAANDTTNLGEMVGANGSIVAFYRDVDDDYKPVNKPRFADLWNLSATNALSRTNIGTITVGDTIVDIDATVASNALTLTFENPDDSDISLTIGGTSLTDEAGSFDQLGSTAEDAEVTDVIINGTNSGTSEAAVMDDYGIIVGRDDSDGVKGNADDDAVVLSIPDDQVYAQVSVTLGGSSSDDETGVLLLDDTEVGQASGMNLIVVGGSGINSVAASLLGGAYTESAFTDATDVGAGEFLIQSFEKDGKTALLVAGYNAEDTDKAVTYLLGEDVVTTVGTKYIGSSSTEAVKQ